MDIKTDVTKPDLETVNENAKANGNLKSVHKVMVDTADKMDTLTNMDLLPKFPYCHSPKARQIIVTSARRQSDDAATEVVAARNRLDSNKSKSAADK